MKDKERKGRALKAANRYAPKPGSSALMYGAIGVILLGMALWIVGRFYDLDLLRHPIMIGGAVIVAFAAGVWLRKRRKRQHVRAVDTEYRRDGDPH